MFANSVKKTLAFFEIWEYPLNKKELYKYLYQYKCNKISFEKKIQAVSGIQQKNGYFSLFNIEKYIKNRANKSVISCTLWNKVNRYLKILYCIPFIETVCISNTLALNIPNDKSDIDLFIIIKKNRLWITRSLITFILQILGVRRNNKKISKRFCLSFFITDENLNISRIAIKDFDIYFMYWLSSLKPIIDKGLYKKFIQSNIKLLDKFLPNSLVKINHNNKYILKNNFIFLTINKLLTFLLDKKIGNFIEQWLKYILKQRALKKRNSLKDTSGIIISDNILKFHNIDKREYFKLKWINICKENNIDVN